MPPVLSKLKNKKLHGQSREIVFNVLKFFEEEARTWDGTNLLIPIKKCQARCSRATGVSVNTVRTIKKESKSLIDGTEFATPDKHRIKKKTVTSIEDFDRAVIRRTVHSFFVNEKCLPTVNKLRMKLIDSINFQGSNTSLRRILKELGFKWRKTRNNRKLLIEREDIRNDRINFIRKIRQYRKEGRPVVYTDETYVVTEHSAPYSWQDNTTEGVHTPISGGDRVIIVHAGGEDGFIPNAFLQWKASQKTGDYHLNMNQVNYEKWVREKLLPNLKPKSVVVLDNASYHTVKTERVPTKSSTKADMQDWLLKHSIPFTPTMFKAELYDLVYRNKPPVKYSLEKILEARDHIVLRLPPYHPDLNPIELIWSQLKRNVANKNTSFSINSIMDLVQSEISKITEIQWKKCCEHVIKIEDDYVQREGIIDDFVDRIVINLEHDDSDSDSEDTDAASHSSGDLSGVEELAPE